MRFFTESRVALLLLRKLSLRHWCTSWANYLVLIAIVAIGVGAFSGIRQAIRAASANFSLFNEAVSGQSDFLIRSVQGPISSHDLESLVAVAASPDWHLVPVIESSVALLDESGVARQQLRLIGLDLLSLGNLPNFLDRGFDISDGSSDWWSALGPSDQVWITHSLAHSAGLAKDDRIEIVFGGLLRAITVAGIIGSPADNLPEDLIIGDLPSVQGWAKRPSELNRIEVVVTDTSQRADRNFLAAIEARIQARLPVGYRLEATAEQAAKRASMTEAFRLNLVILSLIAMLVAAYLILQALDAAVVRRRHEMATLKSLGLSARVLFALNLLEACLIGLLGSIGGLAVGYLLAWGAVHLLADTVNALYFATSTQAIQLSAEDCWIGLSLGMCFSLLAGWLPARDAMQTPPAQILARGDWSPGFAWLRRPQIGLSLFTLGGFALLIPPSQLAGGAKMALGGFLAAGCWIFAGALLSGQLLTRLAQLLQPLSPRAIWRIAVSRLADGSSRHRLAVAGLVVAVSMVTGMFQMVGSFRGTIEVWFDVRFQADLYVSERGVTGQGNANGITPEVLHSLSIIPELAFMDALYIEQVEGPIGVTTLAGADFSIWEEGRVQQIWLRAPGTLTGIVDAQPAYVSETFARRFDVMNGGAVELLTPTGPQRITVMGIFADYGNEFGSAVVDVPIWQEWTQRQRAINTTLYLQPDIAVNTVRDRLRLEYPGLDFRNSQELRTLALGIFNDTFRVTAALNGIGITVAFIGLLLGLMAIFEESAQTWRTLKQLGISYKQLLLTAGIEGAGIAFAAYISGTLMGLALGAILIKVINVQSFGWSLLWQLPFGSFALLGLVMVTAGFICGIGTAAWWHKKR